MSQCDYVNKSEHSESNSDAGLELPVSSCCWPMVVLAPHLSPPSVFSGCGCPGGPASPSGSILGISSCWNRRLRVPGKIYQSYYPTLRHTDDSVFIPLSTRVIYFSPDICTSYGPGSFYSSQICWQPCRVCPLLNITFYKYYLTSLSSPEVIGHTNKLFNL